MNTPHLKRASNTGFTVIELLVVLGVTATFAAMLATAHSGTKASGRSFQCLANTKQLMLANLLYQAENSEVLPMVLQGGFVPGASSKVRPWVTGWLNWDAFSDNTNDTMLLERPYASLAIYFGKDRRVYKCPADTFVSSVQKAKGWKTRNRSFSANVYVGRGNGWYTDTIAGYNASGPNNLTIYKGAAKSSDLLIPGPARTWVYMDEHPDSINDPAGFPPDSATDIPDLPGTSHNGAAGFAMADGHSEMHQWSGPLMTRPRSQLGGAGVALTEHSYWSTVYDDPDVFWYSFSSPRVSTRTVSK